MTTNDWPSGRSCGYQPTDGSATPPPPPPPETRSGLTLLARREAGASGPVTDINTAALLAELAIARKAGAHLPDPQMDVLIEWQRKTAEAEDEASALRCEVGRLRAQVAELTTAAEDLTQEVDDRGTQIQDAANAFGFSADYIDEVLNASLGMGEPIGWARDYLCDALNLPERSRDLHDLAELARDEIAGLRARVAELEQARRTATTEDEANALRSDVARLRELAIDRARQLDETALKWDGAMAAVDRCGPPACEDGWSGT